MQTYMPSLHTLLLSMSRHSHMYQLLNNCKHALITYSPHEYTGMHILHESPDSLRRQMCMLYATVNIALYKHMGHVGGQESRLESKRNGVARLASRTLSKLAPTYQHHYPDLMNDRLCVCVCACVCVNWWNTCGPM